MCTLRGLLIAALGAWVVAGTARADPGLADLLQAGNDTAAARLIASGANVNAPQSDGTTALDWATYHLNVPLVRALLEHGADPNAMNHFGSSPLGEAVKAANVELVKILLRAGAKADAPNADGQTAFMLAARDGQVPIAKLLLRRGANVNAREKWRGQTALMWAAAQGYPEMTAFLVKHGARVDVREIYNDWLDRATQMTSEPRAQYRPEGGLTALLYAVRSGCAGCVAALLKGGADVNKPTPEGITPLMSALDNLQFSIAKYLLLHGANPSTWDWYGRTPLYIAVDMHTFIRRFGPGYGAQTQPGRLQRAESQEAAVEIVRMLLDAGVDPNVQLDLHRPGRGGNSGRFTDDLLRTGCTPLLRAAMSHDNELIELLLAHGALVDLPNVNGVTPLIAAAGMGMRGGPDAIVPDLRGDFGPDAAANAVRTLDILIKAGANVNARVTDTSSHSGRIARASSMTKRQGETALYGAIFRGWTPVVQYLLRHGARVDVTDDLGRTPLMAAKGADKIRGFRPVPQIVAILTQASAARRVTSTLGLTARTARPLDTRGSIGLP
ncbi:MAG TPA: ankyrin repeat domain-containing protein [Steroidobacteraceae bacterium]|nr:ankyrin repeat domain-containing protein [Steroidobacteraceae bacterium]